MKAGFSKVSDRKLEINTAEALTQSIIETITNGFLAPGLKLPSVNEMAELVGLNRLTVLKSLDELEIEGWIVKKKRSGSFVAEKLPVDIPKTIGKLDLDQSTLPQFAQHGISQLTQNYFKLSFNDGYPDHRLFPSVDMARAFSTTYKTIGDKKALLYGDVYGHEMLRNALSSYIHKTRGIRADHLNVLVTRGSTLAIYLVTKTVCEKGDVVAIASPGYYLAKEMFEAEKLRILEIPVDEDGLVTSELEVLVKKHPIKMLYVTPHHQYPTTVTMSASRRMELLRIANENNFYVLEDDYDFDFQYDRRPILPVASIDQLHRVIYVGGFSKSLSPSLRTGYIVANERIVTELGKWRKIIDRQGDTIQELAFSELLTNGTIEKTIRKAIKVYHDRRDFAHTLITDSLLEFIEPDFCKGGLAFWTEFKLSSNQIETLLQKTLGDNLFLIDPRKYVVDGKYYARMGFASMNQEEMIRSVEILKSCCNSIK